MNCTNKSEEKWPNLFGWSAAFYPAEARCSASASPLQSRFALPRANIDLISRGIQFIFVWVFFPVQGVWLSQWGTGRKGAEEDEGLLWALSKVWTLVSGTNLDILMWLNWLASCIYFLFSVHPLSPSLIHGGHKFITDLIFGGSCFQLNWLRLPF